MVCSLVRIALVAFVVAVQSMVSFRFALLFGIRSNSAFGRCYRCDSVFVRATGGHFALLPTLRTSSDGISVLTEMLSQYFICFFYSRTLSLSLPLPPLLRSFGIQRYAMLRVTQRKIQIEQPRISIYLFMPWPMCAFLHPLSQPVANTNPLRF